MSDKEKKIVKSSNDNGETSIKTVSVFLSLENCENFIAKQNHADRVAKLRTEALAYIRETEFLYSRKVVD